MGHQQVGSPGDRLVDDGLDGVDRQQHPADLLVGVAGHEPDRVPVLRPARVVQGVESSDHVTQAERPGHARARTWNGRTQSSWVPSSIESRHE